MRRVLVACLGNPLMGDDGVGFRVARELVKRGLSDVVFCGSDATAILSHVDGVKRLIVVDTVDWGSEPGSIIVARLEEVEEEPSRWAHNLSPTRLIKLIKSLSCGDVEVYIVGVQPKNVAPSEELTEPVKRAVELAVSKVEELVSELRDFRANA